MDVQNIIALLLLGVVLIYLGRKFVIKPLRRATIPQKNCGPDCKCG